MRNVEGHNLTIKIKKNGVEFFSSPVEVTEKISITSGRAEKLPPRYEQGNDKDLSHLINFNSPQMLGKAFKFKDTPMTILSVFDACFYSKTLSAREYTIQKNGKTLFTRRIGVITGGDIVAVDQTEIKFAQSPEKNQTLKAEAGVVYEVIFDNDCPYAPEDGTSDFDDYDKVIRTTDKFTLVGPDVMAFQGDPPTKDPPSTTAEGGDEEDRTGGG